MTSDYRVEWNGPNAVFTLCRVAKHNSLTLAVLEGLAQTLDELESRRGRGLIIIGDGQKAFCAGTDLQETSELNQLQKTQKTHFARELFFRIYNSSVTSIAAINGLAYGGGLELAMACTLRIAAPHATFSLPEVKLAVIPCYGGTQYLPALVGRGRALDMMLTGEVVDAEHALQIGLISSIASEQTSLIDQACELLAGITCHSQVAIDGIRQAVAMAGDGVSRAGLEAEQLATVRVSESSDAKEGVRAFLEKRSPNYQHR